MKRRRYSGGRSGSRSSAKMYKDWYTAGNAQLAMNDANWWGTNDITKVRREAFHRGTESNRYAFGPSFRLANDDQRKRRLLVGYKGAGDYTKYARWVPRIAGGLWGGLTGAAGAAGGGLPGVISGAASGAAAGWDAGAGYSKMFGWGDYGPVSSNKIIGSGEGAQQQIEVNNDSLTGDIYFSHTEYIGNVTALTPSVASGSTSFQLKSYDLNPGLKTLPFLSQIASNFELYQWQGVIFQYKPTSGEFGASSVSNSLGKIVMATKYGITQDTPFSSMIEMQNYDYANSSKPSCGMVHGVETDPKQNMSEMLLVRTGAAPGNVPKVLYDLGKFYVATEGIPFSGANQTIVLGELWVTYRVKLSRAKLFDTLGGDNDWAHAVNTATSGALYTGTTTTAGNLALTFTNVVSGARCLVQFPASVVKGRYYVRARFASAVAGTHVWYSSTGAVNGASVVVQTVAPNDGTGAQGNFYSIWEGIVDVDSPNQVQAAFELNRSGNVAGNWSIDVFQINPAVTVL